MVGKICEKGRSDLTMTCFFTHHWFLTRMICLTLATVHRTCPDGFWRMICFSTLRRLKLLSLEPDNSYTRPTVLPVSTWSKIMCRLLIQLKVLGVTLDSPLTFSMHVTNIVPTCNFHICVLGHIKPFLSLDSAKSVAMSVIMSRLDCCNSLRHLRL